MMDKILKIKKAMAGREIFITRAFFEIQLFAEIIDEMEGTSAADNLINNDNNLIIRGMGGNDTIYNAGRYVTIEGGAGIDSIDNRGSNVKIDGGDGDDKIYNNGDSVTIDGGAGNDYIDNSGNNVTIDGGDGDDKIYNNGDSVTIDGGTGNDYIYNIGSSVTIDGGIGNDSIYNYGSSVTIDAGAGNDSLITDSNTISILGGDGADFISLGSSSSNVTVQGGTGDDNIVNYGGNVIYQYANGDGKDTITGYSTGDTIQIAADSYTTAVSGSHKVINVGNGSITLLYAKSKALNVKLISSLNLTAIQNSENSISLAGTNDADTISNSGDNVTINAGTGDDIISLTGGSQNNVIEYIYGDGNDTIFGYDSTTAIQTDDFNYAYTDGNDLIINVGGNLITLKDAAGSAVQIIETSGRRFYTGAPEVPFEVDGNIFYFYGEDSIVEVSDEGFILRNGVSAEGSGRFILLPYGESIETYYYINGVEYNVLSKVVIEDNFVREGTLIVRDSINLPNDTLFVRGDDDGITVVVDDGYVTSITGLEVGGVVEFDERTYSRVDYDRLIVREGEDWLQWIYLEVENYTNILELVEGIPYLKTYENVIDLNGAIEYLSDYGEIIFGSDDYYEGEEIARLYAYGSEYNLEINEDFYYRWGDIVIEATYIENLNLNVYGYDATVNLGSGEQVINGTIYRSAGDYISIYVDGEQSRLIEGAVYLDEYSNFVRLLGEEVGEIEFIEGDGFIVEAEDGVLWNISDLNEGDAFAIHDSYYNYNYNDYIFTMTPIGLVRRASEEEYPLLSEYDTTDFNVEQLLYGDWTPMIVAQEGVLDLREMGDSNSAVIVNDFEYPTEWLGAINSSYYGDNKYEIDCGYNDAFDTILLDSRDTSLVIDRMHNLTIQTAKSNATYMINGVTFEAKNSALTIGFVDADDPTLIEGTATIFDSLRLSDGETISVSGDADGVVVTVMEGYVTSITGLNNGGTVNYDGTTYQMINDELVTTNENDKIRIYRFVSENSNILEMIVDIHTLYVPLTINEINLNDIINIINDDAVSDRINIINGDVEAVIFGVDLTYRGDYLFEMAVMDDNYYALRANPKNYPAEDFVFNASGVEGNLTLNVDFSTTIITAEGSATYKINGNEYAAFESALQIAATPDNSALVNGIVAVTDNLETQDGKIIAVTGDADGVVVTVANGVATSITGLNNGGAVNYDGTTYQMIDGTLKVTAENQERLYGDVSQNSNLLNMSESYALYYQIKDNVINLSDGKNILKGAVTSIIYGGDASYSGNYSVALAVENDVYTFTKNDGAKIADLTIDARGLSGGFTLTAGFDAVITTAATTEEIVINATAYQSTGEALTIATTANGSALINGTVFVGESGFSTANGDFVAQVAGNGITVEVVDGAVANVTGLDANEIFTVNDTEFAVIGKFLKATSGAKVAVYKDWSGYLSGENMIYNNEAKNFVAGTKDGDIIYNEANNATINAGKGDDVIFSYGENNLIEYNEGDGNDIIYGLNDDDTLKIIGAEYSTVTSGEDLVVTVNKHRITVSGSTSINIDGKEQPVTLTGTSKADKISNEKDEALINALAGKDSITNSGSNVSISAGADADVISIIGGANSTINGGKGNDSIYGNETGNVYQYSSGDGNDVIFGFNENDTLQIASGTIKSTLFSGNDFVINVGSGSITLKNIEKGAEFTLIDAKGNATTEIIPKVVMGTAKGDKITNELDEYKVYGEAGNDSITNSGANVLVDGGAGNDRITLSGGENVTVSGGKGNDSIYGNDDGNFYQYGSGDGNDVIFGFNENDTLQITSGAIKSSVISGNDFVVSVGSGSVTLKEIQKGAEFTLIDAKGNTTTEIIPKVVMGTSKAEKLTNENDDYKVYGEAGNDSITNSGSNVLVDGGAGNDKITISGGENITVVGGKGNDSIYGADSDNVYRYSKGDGKDVIYGFKENDTIQIASGSLKGTAMSGADFVMSIDSGSITLKDVDKGIEFTLIDASGKDSVIEIPKIIMGSSKVDTINNENDNYKIYGEAGNDLITNSGSNVLVDGGAGNDKITLSGGENVTVIGGKGNDSIYGEDSDNIYRYSTGDGNDVIYGFKENDTLQIASGTLKSTAMSGADFVMNIGSGSITLKDVEKGIDFTLIDAKGNVTTQTIPRMIVSNKVTNELDGYEIFGTTGKDSIVNSGSSVLIDGKAGDDKITLNGGENITVSGGKGNDSIYAADAENIFFSYSTGDGKDVIYGFNEDDTIQIASGTLKSTAMSGADFVLNVGSGSITLKDIGGGTEINLIDAKGVESVVEVPKIIVGTSKADTINNEDDDFKIYGEGGNDLITNSGSNVLIEGGAGNDKITLNGGENVTVTGGKGNDSIYAADAEGVIFNYAAGDGKDVIIGFTDSDRLNITGEAGAASVKGNDTIIKVGSGSITLKDYWFTEENEYVAENQLDSITEIAADYSNGDYSATDYQNLAQDKTIITAAK